MVEKAYPDDQKGAKVLAEAVGIVTSEVERGGQ